MSSPITAARAHAAAAPLTRSDVLRGGPPDSIDFSAPPALMSPRGIAPLAGGQAPAAPLAGDFSRVGSDLEVGIYRSINLPTQAMPLPRRSYMPPSMAMALLEPERAAAINAGAPKKAHNASFNRRQTACLVFLAVLAGATIGGGIYLGAIRPHQI